MADTEPTLQFEDIDDDDELDEAAVRYVEASDRLEVGARILRVFAYSAAVLWAIVVVCAVSVYWDQLDTKSDSVSSGPYASQIAEANNQRVPKTILAVAGATWPYLAIAVIAYGGALLVDGRRLDSLLEAVMDDDDEDEDEDGDAAV